MDKVTRTRGPLSYLGVPRAYLIAKGFAYVGIGWSWLAFPSSARQAGIEWVPLLTTWAVGACWIIGGLIAVYAGVSDTQRRAGFAALQGVAFALALVFLVSATVRGTLLVALALLCAVFLWIPNISRRVSIAVCCAAAAAAIGILLLPHFEVFGGNPKSITTAISYGAFWVSALLVAQIGEEGEPDGRTR